MVRTTGCEHRWPRLSVMASSLVTVVSLVATAGCTGPQSQQVTGTEPPIACTLGDMTCTAQLPADLPKEGWFTEKRGEKTWLSRADIEQSYLYAFRLGWHLTLQQLVDTKGKDPGFFPPQGWAHSVAGYEGGRALATQMFEQQKQKHGLDKTIAMAQEALKRQPK